jgi:hypothetical protein
MPAGRRYLHGRRGASADHYANRHGGSREYPGNNRAAFRVGHAGAADYGHSWVYGCRSHAFIGDGRRANWRLQRETGGIRAGPPYVVIGD